MLDSLVRVSRRVGWGAYFVTDPGRAGGGSRSQNASRGRRALRAVLASREAVRTTRAPPGGG